MISQQNDNLVVVATIQSLARRLHKLDQFDLIIFDEAHHCQAETWQKLLAAQPDARLLGVSATPARLDGKGLGVEAGGPFDDLVRGPDIAELAAGGYLSPARCFVPEQRLNLSGVRTRGGDYLAADLESVVNDRAIIGDVVDQYRRRADHIAAIAFCVVNHAEHVAEMFRNAGYPAACVHGKLPAPERDTLIAGLSDGSVEVLASCDLISEGLDVPAVGAVILLRPTKSLSLFLQQCGRGMRPAPGKDALVVLDHVGNSLVHGLPEAAREWSLTGAPKEAGKQGLAAPVWRCDCGCLNPLAANVCCDCGEPRPGRTDNFLEVAEGELVELTAEKLARARQLTYGQVLRLRLSEAELRAFALARGYKRGWVQHRLREQAFWSAAA
jgi:DNA repair protein RadD